MANNRRLLAVDCETDPAQYERVPKPFLWGVYDGKDFTHYRSTDDFVSWLSQQHALAYAHNGGKFDFMFLLRYIHRTKAQIINGRIVSMKIGKCELRDSFAIVPQKLKLFGKLDIDIAKLEAEVREQHMDEIITYNKQDCVSLWELCFKFREIAGKKSTIAANAQAFAKKLGVDYGKTTPTFDRKLREFFNGGRCQVFRPGTFKNVRGIDIHSAYAFAMLQDHPKGVGFSHISDDEFYSLPLEDKQRCFIHLKCYSDGAFPWRTKTGLDFPERFDEYKVTGWEFIAAEDLGLIRDVEIIDVIRLFDVVNFTPYVTHWYDFKARHSKKLNPMEYEIGKRMMNALYGKGAQDIRRYYDYMIVPGGTYICYDFQPDSANMCSVCGTSAENHGWELADEYENIEIHRRPALWKYQFKYGDGWQGIPLYNNVATSASITGFTRAHLLKTIHALGRENVYYCDTDGIYCDARAPLDRVAFSDKLGDWENEGVAVVGHFAGKKLYGLDWGPDKAPEDRYKVAHKGSKLAYAEILEIMAGKTVTWENPFPAFSLAGRPSFMVRNIRATAILPTAHFED